MMMAKATQPQPPPPQQPKPPPPPPQATMQQMHPGHDGDEVERLHDLVESQTRVITDQARLIRSLRELR